MHNKLEEKMEKVGLFVHDNPLKTIIVLIMLLAFPLAHVPQIKMDTSTEGFLHEHDPVLLTYNKFRGQFGRDERVVIAIKSENIFTLPFLTKLTKLHNELKTNVPYLDDITSLYNVRNTRGVKDSLITDDLLEPFPKTEQDIKSVKQRALESHFYKDLLISQDATMTTIILETDAYSHKGEKEVSDEDAFTDGFEESTIISETKKEFLSDQENAELLEAVHEIVKKYETDGFKIYVAGSPAVNNSLKAQMQKDMQKFMKITFLIIIVFLYVVFRRVSAVVYPLLVIVISLLTTVGTMAYMGVAFKLPTQIVPSLLLAVSIGATVHILSIFFDNFNTLKDKREALRITLGHSGLAIAMTSVTTAIGVGSFSGSAVAPISDLGVFASLGVMVSLVLTLTLLPALLSLTRLKPKVLTSSTRLDSIMGKFALIPVKYTKTILISSFIIVLVSLLAATQLKLSHNPLYWFQPDDINRYSTVEIDKTMNGTVTIELILDAKKENAWIDPEKIAKLNQFTKEIETYKDEYTHIGKVVSLATIVKETNRALHENKEEYYTIPSDKNLLSQELLLFENSGSDDLEDVVDSAFSKVRVTIKLPWTDAVNAVGVLNYVQTKAKDTFKDDNVEVTGMIPLLINTFSSSVNSAVQSYFLAGVGISLMMMIILGSVRIGLLSMIPNLTPIIMGLLIMYIAKIPLDMFTLLIGSIAIGLAVDDTIHFIHNFQRYFHKTKDVQIAIQKTFYTTGKAMLITTFVLSLGFYSYMAANMISVHNFGLLTGSVIIFALLADLLLAPALMIVAVNRGWIK